jgi:outer membrane protein assembly factor BamD (BamD/ComL family)
MSRGAIAVAAVVAAGLMAGAATGARADLTSPLYRAGKAAYAAKRWSQAGDKLTAYEKADAAFLAGHPEIKAKVDAAIADASERTLVSAANAQAPAAGSIRAAGSARSPSDLAVSPPQAAPGEPFKIQAQGR